MNAFFGNLARSIQPADVADVLLLAAFFYVGILWLRRSSSGSAARRVVVLGILFGSVHLVASHFDLYLMERLLEVLVFVFLIALVVVFQSDIRRLLDRVASWTFAGKRVTAAPSSPVEILTEAAAQLAAARTGALIAVRGAESWDSHIQGGVELDGRISRPLLYSIFNPDTPGHDGAVLIEGDRLTKFAVHLPLATQLPEASRFGGTRHTAALGLAEECDALVIVVSEERGTISVAEKGSLNQLGSPAELGERMERFWKEHYSGSTTLSSRWWSRQTLETTGMALGIAGFTWLLFAYGGDTVYRTYEVPVEFRNLPLEWALESDTVPSVNVTLSGSEQAFERLDEERLVASFDLGDPSPGANVLTIVEESLDLPSGVHLYDASPREVTAVAERQEPLEIPVQIRTIGVLADSFTLLPSPRTVKVLTPRGGADPPTRILTEPVDPRQIPLLGSIKAKLTLPPSVRLHPDETGEVEVMLERRSAQPTR